MMKKQNYVIWVQTVLLYISHIYKDTADDFETKFYTLNYKLDRPLLKIKNKEEIALIKDKLGRKITVKLVGLKS